MAWLGTKEFDSEDFYNFAEMNRQNENVEYLTTEITNKIIALTLPNSTKTDNTRADFPTVTKVNDLRYNIKYLIENVPITEDPAIVVDLERLQSFDFNDANVLERNLQAVYEILLRIQGYFRKCGTFKCGEVNNGL